jgi:hypothetical protein
VQQLRSTLGASLTQAADQAEGRILGRA